MSQRKTTKLLSKRRAKFYEEEDEGKLDINVEDINTNNDIIENKSENDEDDDNNENEEDEDEDVLKEHFSKINKENDTFSLTEIGVVGSSKNKNVLQIKNENNINEEESNSSSNEMHTNNENEKYLQNKLSDINISTNLLSNIRKQIKQQNLKIQKEIYNNEIPFSEIPKSITSLIKHREKTLGDSLNPSNSNNILTLPEDSLKRLKLLKEDETFLKTQISKLESRIHYIENESSLGIKQNDIIQNNIRNDQLKQLREEKESTIAKLETVSLQINEILELLNKKSKNEILKTFLTNFEDETDMINKNLKPIITQSNKQKEIFENNITKLNEKRNKMELKDKAADLKRKKMLLKLREKELETVSRRKKYLNEQMEKTLQSIKDESVQKEKDYLYYINAQKYEEHEKQIVELVKLQKKNKMKLITLDEIKEFNEKLDELKIEQKLEQVRKEEMRKEMWKNRSEILPLYQNPIIQTIMEEQEREQNLLEMKNKKKEELHKKQKEYVNSVLPQVKIKIDDKLVKERQFNTNNISTNRSSIISLKNKLKKPKFVTTLTKSPKKKVNQSQTQPNEGEQTNIHKQKKFVFPTRKVVAKPGKPIDYLTEMRNAKEENGIQMRNYVGNVDTYLENNDLMEGITLAKNETEILDNKLREKKMIMNNSGGYSNNEELGKEIGEMLVNSIQAKLKILDKFNGN